MKNKFSSSLRHGMRHWALMWRNEISRNGTSQISKLCLRRARDWRDGALEMEKLWNNRAYAPDNL
ncbi:MAG TPA: hypothetical protein VK742_01115 [Candidatus Sulfotelmatobacter sp.]|nr:hypothetical protein [Candidatus Sulfotelmatobacter sp.]